MNEHLEQHGEQATGEDAALGGAPEVSDGDLTGHRVVDGVLASLRDLPERPVAEHVEVFESAHEVLRAALANVDDHPSGPTGR